MNYINQTNKKISFREFTYHLHLEAVNLLIVLLSVHLFSQQPTDKSIIFRYIQFEFIMNAFAFFHEITDHIFAFIFCLFLEPFIIIQMRTP